MIIVAQLAQIQLAYKVKQTQPIALTVTTIIIIIMWLVLWWTTGRCRSYELAPCLPILSSVIGSCQTNVQGRQVRFNGP